MKYLLVLYSAHLFEVGLTQYQVDHETLSINAI